MNWTETSKTEKPFLVLFKHFRAISELPVGKSYCMNKESFTIDQVRAVAESCGLVAIDHAEVFEIQRLPPECSPAAFHAFLDGATKAVKRKAPVQGVDACKVMVGYLRRYGSQADVSYDDNLSVSDFMNSIVSKRWLQRRLCSVKPFKGNPGLIGETIDELVLKGVLEELDGKKFKIVLDSSG